MMTKVGEYLSCFMKLKSSRASKVARSGALSSRPASCGSVDQFSPVWDVGASRQQEREVQSGGPQAQD